MSQKGFAIIILIGIIFVVIFVSTYFLFFKEVCVLEEPPDVYVCGSTFSHFVHSFRKRVSVNPRQIIDIKQTPTPIPTPTPKPTESKAAYRIGYSCRVPCTGAKPAEDLERNCFKLLTQKQCIKYKIDEFPGYCEWLPTNYQCPPLP